MIGQMMIAGAAVVALSMGAGPTTSAPAADAASAAKATPRNTERKFTDQDGNNLTVDVDDSGKVVRAQAKDRKGTPIDTVQIKMQDMTVCSPRPGGAQLCQTLTYVSDGAFFKVGTASCTCCSVGGWPVCYGTTCK
jgi:hypothetical protein